MTVCQPSERCVDDACVWTMPVDATPCFNPTFSCLASRPILPEPKAAPALHLQMVAARASPSQAATSLQPVPLQQVEGTAGPAGQCIVPGCGRARSTKWLTRSMRLCAMHMAADSIYMGPTEPCVRYCVKCHRLQAMAEFKGNSTTCAAKAALYNERRRSAYAQRRAATGASVRRRAVATAASDEPGAPGSRAEDSRAAAGGASVDGFSSEAASGDAATSLDGATLNVGTLDAALELGDELWVQMLQQDSADEAMVDLKLRGVTLFELPSVLCEALTDLFPASVSADIEACVRGHRGLHRARLRPPAHRGSGRLRAARRTRRASRARSRSGCGQPAAGRRGGLVLQRHPFQRSA